MSTRLAISALVLAFVAAAIMGCPPKAPASRSGPMPTGPKSKAMSGSAEATANEQATENSAEATPEAANAAAEAPTSEIAKLFETKCTKCHELNIIEKQAHTPEDWTKIVKQMQAKKKGWITDSDAKQIAAYVADKFPEKK
jgi:phage FluMu protein Com